MSINQYDSTELAHQVDLMGMWRVLRARKYVILGAAVLTTALALWMALTATPIYRAEVVITEVTNGNMSGAPGLMSQFGGLASIAGINLGVGGDPGREAKGILRSRRLIEEFIKRNDLQATLLPNADADKPPTLWKAVRRFQDGIFNIREDKRSGLLTAAVEWTDPAVAARWANDLVALTNEIVRTRAIEESTRNVTYLNEQIARTDVVELRRAMYNLIESETKTLMLANARTEYAFTILDPAVPPEVRISPKRTVIVFLGVTFGLIIGAALAFALDFWRRLKERSARSGR